MRVALTTGVCMRMKYVTTCSTDIDELTDYTYRFYYLFIVETSSLLHTTKKISGLSSIKKVEGKLENNESTKSNFG